MKLGVLVSGRGSNMNALIEACEQGRLDAKVVIVISNNAKSHALLRAQEKNITTRHIGSSNYPNADELDREMTSALEEKGVDLVILAGFMKKIGPRMLSKYKGKIINIHPSLLPRHGGKGMFGMNVHKAVIESGDEETGVTIHLVNDEYDGGAILAQRRVPVNRDDVPEALAERVLKVEHVLFAETIQKIIDGSIILPTD